MSLPPLLLDLRVESPGRRRIRLWLPVVLLWPLALALAAVALLLALAVDAVLFAAGRRYHHYSALLARSFAVVGDTRGLVIHIDNANAAVHVTVR